METQAENVKAKQILEEEALKEKAAQLRAKEQNDQQNLVDLTLAQGKEIYWIQLLLCSNRDCSIENFHSKDADNRRFLEDLQRAKEEADLLSKEMLGRVLEICKR